LSAMGVRVEKQGSVCTVIIDRPDVKNAVDRPTADMLAGAFREFDSDSDLRAAVLWGAGGIFCAGADLKAAASASPERFNRLNEDMGEDGPMGPSRMKLSKPVIAAVSGYAVAGGLELACWCDMRVMEEDAIFGVFCRRWGVPLMDGGTQRLPRLIGLSNALDMILTGRPIGAEEALAMGLANRVVPRGKAREEAERIAAQLGEFPQKCMLGDREAAYRGFELDFDDAMALEFKIGLETVASGETLAGATEFARGKGRHGEF
jgi:enoyl-CoA hydratase